MSRFRIKARAEIYAIYEIEAKSEEQARQLFLDHKAKYICKDTSDDHMTISENNIISIEQQ